MRPGPIFGAVALICATVGHPPLGAATVGLVPASTPEMTDALVAGLRAALDDVGTSCGHRLELVVGAGATHWSTATAPTVEMAFGAEVIALVTPPDRATAHLIAQIGSRSHIPVVSTSRAPSIRGTGSYWVAQILEPRTSPDVESTVPPEISELSAVAPEFETLFRARVEGDSDGWTATGFATGLVLGRAICASGLDRRKIALYLEDLLATGRLD